MPPFPALRAFEAAARSLSFRRPPKSCTSRPRRSAQQVKSLEDYLGVRLFVRQTRRIRVDARSDGHAAEAAGGLRVPRRGDRNDAPPGGTLTVSAAPNFAVLAAPRLPEFSSAHPQINLRLSSSRNAIDAPMATAAAVNLDPLASDSEVSIRFGSGALQGRPL